MGYESHAAFQLAPKMAATPATAASFLSSISARLQRQLDVDMADLKSMACSAMTPDPTHVDNLSSPSLSARGEIASWDVAFCSRLLKEARHAIDDEVVREFFPLEHVRANLLNIYEELLGLRFERLDPAEAGVWHSDVEAFAVFDDSKDCELQCKPGNDRELLGIFFLDLFSRNGKFGHQCVIPLAPSFIHRNGTASVPQCAILGNLTKPSADRPSLLRFAEVHTFFHEFGHVMHAVLTRVRYSEFAWTWPMMVCSKR